MATEAVYPPFQYVNEGKIVGYEIDLAIRFCEKYGYKLELKNMSLDSILPAIQSGKYDFGCSAMITGTLNFPQGTITLSAGTGLSRRMRSEKQRMAKP